MHSIFDYNFLNPTEEPFFSSIAWLASSITALQTESKYTKERSQKTTRIQLNKNEVNFYIIKNILHLHMLQGLQ